MDQLHRRDREAVEEVQKANEAWWTRNTMSYDWDEELGVRRGSLEWFDEIDRRFMSGARLFSSGSAFFGEFIPFEELRGKRVLEIGCGMGLHSELIARSGAHLTSLDLSPVSVQMTQRRFELKALTATVQQGDAESLPFADQSFDFIWSWGVIHHSSRTGRIVREIARVCSPAGRVCVMVYNRQALSVGLGVLRDQLLRGGLGRRSIEESLYANTDGYTARHYVKDQFEDLFRTFFREVSSEICGQESDVLPLPRRLRDAVMRYLPESYAKQAQARRGAFIVLRARSPE